MLYYHSIIYEFSYIKKTMPVETKKITHTPSLYLYIIYEVRNTILPNSGSHTIRYEDCSSVILFLTSH